MATGAWFCDTGESHADTTNVCNSFTTVTCDTNAGCTWNSGSGACEEDSWVPCANNTIEQDCLDAGCSWSGAVCAEGTAAGTTCISHAPGDCASFSNCCYNTILALCKDAGICSSAADCHDFDNDGAVTCEANNRMWMSTTASCMPK